MFFIFYPLIKKLIFCTLTAEIILLIDNQSPDPLEEEVFLFLHNFFLFVDCVEQMGRWLNLPYLYRHIW